MLQDSLPNSADSSAPPSPRRRLVEPGRALWGSPSHSRKPEGPDGAPGARPALSGISASAFSPGYFERFFLVERELGRGGKGVVLLVNHVLDQVHLGQYACKRVPVGNDHAWLTNVLNEVRLLEHLSHQHLVYYKHVWLEDIKISTFGPSVPCAFILQQYCNAGDLHKYIFSPAQNDESNSALKERVRRRSKNLKDGPREIHGRRLKFEEIYSFFKDVTSGLNHLHVNGFIHRDLKPSNCLLHHSGQGLRVLVSDFGEVQIENMVRKSTGATGTVSYCAPEVLRRDPSTGALGNFTTKSDIFSLGMILYFLCFARLPYSNADHLNEENEDVNLLREEIVSWTGLHEERKLRPDLPEQLYTFLRRLLSLNPDERPSAEDILLGIKTGSGLDEISDSRPNSAAHMFDDLSASSRISPVDSPRPMTPVRKSSSTFLSQGGSRSKMRLQSFTAEHRTSQSPPPSSSKVVSGSSDEDTPTKAQTATSPSDSLVLRERFPSPTKFTHKRHVGVPPRSSSWFGIIQPRDPTLQRSTKLVVFLGKAFSLNAVCSPMAMRPVVLYPLLGLASIDFLFQSYPSDPRRDSRGTLVSAALILLHFAVLLVVRRYETLCNRTFDAF